MARLSCNKDELGVGGTRAKATYRAVEVSAPGTLRVMERPIPEPGASQVRIRVDACGVCHSDAATVTGSYPGLALPRVPDARSSCRIEALDTGVSRWKNRPTRRCRVDRRRRWRVRKLGERVLKRRSFRAIGYGERMA
jgi:NADPH:quinone reductase-like Zn-dependent oxidoreductase